MTQRIVLITGGSEGMGLAAAERFHAMGDQVVITGRSQEKMNKVSSRHSTIHTIVSDISSPVDRVRLFSDLKEQFGHIAYARHVPQRDFLPTVQPRSGAGDVF